MFEWRGGLGLLSRVAVFAALEQHGRKKSPPAPLYQRGVKKICLICGDRLERILHAQHLARANRSRSRQRPHQSVSSRCFATAWHGSSPLRSEVGASFTHDDGGNCPGYCGDHRISITQYSKITKGSNLFLPLQAEYLISVSDSSARCAVLDTGRQAKATVGA